MFMGYGYVESATRITKNKSNFKYDKLNSMFDK